MVRAVYRVWLPLALALASVTACDTAPHYGSVGRADGSSTVYPLTEAVAEEFLRATTGARVTVSVSGTGGGFRRLCRAEIDVANASRPISTDEQRACASAGVRFVEVPVARDGVTIVVHPDNDWVSALSIEDLGRLWRHEAEGRVRRWSDVRPEFPDREIHLYGAGVDSGTFDHFSAAVTGTLRDTRGDYTASEDDNTLVQGVSGDVGALGFFGFAYYDEHRGRVKAVPIAPGGGLPPVSPTHETIRSGAYHPLSRPVFLYVRADSLARPEVRDFVTFYLHHVDALARAGGFVALDAETSAKARARVEAGVTGSIYTSAAATPAAPEGGVGHQ